ncbi:MAG: hypothetical protein HY897_17435, partial [Deltaproteobacteria bacterium]|nr:hypothetical protein [Deltaproteobacteria bacterium]
MKLVRLMLFGCIALAGGCYYDLDQYLEDAAGVVGKPDAGVPADAGMERDAGADAGTTDTGTSDTG